MSVLSGNELSKLYIGNTDHQWFDYLSKLDDLEEVNFWAPSTKSFKAIKEGDLFLFRLKSPRNLIGGYGTLSTATNATIDFAWDSLGIRNGMGSIEDFIQLIGKYRKGQSTDRHTEIGCKLIVNPVFLEEKDWFEAPSDWSPYTVSGKSYDLKDSLAQDTLALLKKRSVLQAIATDDDTEFNIPSSGEPPVKFSVSVARTRLGQGAFRYKVAKAYNFTCSFSGAKVVSVLDAAHIKPVSNGGTHEVANSLFLRKDLHKLFDLGLITVTVDNRIKLSPKIAEIYEDVETYSNLDGQEIRPPTEAHDAPSQIALSWHRDNTYVS